MNRSPWMNSVWWRQEGDAVDEQSQVEAGGSRRWMNSSPWRLERGSRWWMNRSPRRPVLRYAPPLPMNTTLVSTVGGRREVRFLHFVVRHTPPDQQDPVSTVGGRREVRFLRFAVRQTPPDEQDPVLTVGGRIEGHFLRS